MRALQRSFTPIGVLGLRISAENHIKSKRAVTHSSGYLKTFLYNARGNDRLYEVKSNDNISTKEIVDYIAPDTSLYFAYMYIYSFLKYISYTRTVALIAHQPSASQTIRCASTASTRSAVVVTKIPIEQIQMTNCDNNTINFHIYTSQS